MKLDTKLWHVRLYFWCLDVWDGFLDGYTYRDKANLCQYVRTIFVWMPIALGAQIGLFAFAFYTLAYYPISRFGSRVYAWVIITVFLIVLAIRIFLFLKRKVREKSFRRMALELAQPIAVPDAKEKHDPGLFEVIWAFLAAAKKKICPIIEFTDSRAKGGA